MNRRRAKLPIDAVKFTDTAKVLVAKVHAFFARLGVVGPDFARPIESGTPTLQDALDLLGPGSKVVYLGPEPHGIDLGAVKGVAFDKAWVDDVSPYPAPHPNCKCEPGPMKPISFVPSSEFADFLAGKDNPNAPDVMLDPFINHDPATGAVTAYGFRCYGRGLGRQVHRIAIDARSADLLAAESVRSGKWPYHAARERWEECRREATRQHAADLILPIVAAFKKSQLGGT